MWWWRLLPACVADPWRGAPPAPDRPPDEVWEVALHGQPVGLERAWTEGDRQLRRRTLRILADGEEVIRRSSLDLEGLEPTRRFLLWTPEAEVEGSGPAWWPLAAVPPEGSVPLLGGDGSVSPAEVRADRGGWVIEGRRGRWRLEAEGGGAPSTLRWAGLSLVRLAADREDPEAVDVARILTRPAPALPAARRSLVGRYRVGDREVRVDVPSAAELPPEADPIRRLALEVDRELADRAAPFGGPPGTGDCTEHAVRFVERAAQAGFQARTAAGLLVVTEPPGLAPHAWAEVRLGDRWIPVDPALGQVPADAGHLRLGGWVDELAAADGVPVEVLELR